MIKHYDCFKSKEGKAKEMKITVEVTPNEIIELTRKRKSLDGKKYADIISNSLNKAFQEAMKNL